MFSPNFDWDCNRNVAEVSRFDSEQVPSHRWTRFFVFVCASPFRDSLSLPWFVPNCNFVIRDLFVDRAVLIRVIVI